MADFSNSDDVIDLRDIIARVEELEEYEEDGGEADASELRQLRRWLAECVGNGGDEQWRGDWYPITLIRDSYFENYAVELADDLGVNPPGVSWPFTCIDWEKAARELQVDYTAVDFDGVTYWVR
jgi:hypothetical protein